MLNILSGTEWLFLVFVSVVAYVYVAYFVRTNVLLPISLAIATLFIAFFAIMIFGVGGYAITSIVVPPLLHKIVKKITVSEKSTAVA